MAKTKTTSIMSDGQIDQVVADFRASLRRYRGDFSRDSVQWVLGLHNPTFDSAQAFYKRVKAVSEIHTRRVTVRPYDRKYHTLEQEARGTGLQLYGGYKSGARVGFPDFAAVEPVPRGADGEEELYFFNHHCTLNDEELEKEYAWRGLKAADPFWLFALHQTEPNFLGKLQRVCGHDCFCLDTHWKNAAKRWCHLSLSDDELIIGPHTYAWTSRNPTDVRDHGGDYCEQNTFFAGIPLTRS